MFLLWQHFRPRHVIVRIRQGLKASVYHADRINFL
jgi:hypothetical protein